MTTIRERELNGVTIVEYMMEDGNYGTFYKYPDVPMKVYHEPPSPTPQTKQPRQQP